MVDRPAADARVVRADLRRVSKTYGQIEVLHDIDLRIDDGEFFTLLGPSGSGKTTILRVIAGLVEVTGGTVEIGGVDAAHLKPYERDVAVVFQSLALFPHMSVFDNVAFPLRMRRAGKREIRQRVAEALDVVRLPDIGHRRPEDLSGGQRQRVALARALVYRPSLVLLDEPLAALDRRLREDMQSELARLHRELGITFVNVTHDQREALLLSTRIGIVDHGRLIQVGTPREIYGAPASRTVARFLGDAAVVPGRILPDRSLLDVGFTVLRIPDQGSETDASLVLRSEALTLSRLRPAPDDDREAVAVQVASAAYEGVGDLYRLLVVDSTVELSVTVPPTSVDPDLAPGDTGWVSWDVHEAPVILEASR